MKIKKPVVSMPTGRLFYPGHRKVVIWSLIGILVLGIGLTIYLLTKQSEDGGTE